MINQTVIEILDTIIFEYPETVMQVIMHVLVTWLGAPGSKTPNELERYREYKFHSLAELIRFMQEAFDLEKYRYSLGDLKKRLYPRKSFPADRELPIYNRERAKELGEFFLAHVQTLGYEDVLRLYSEILIAYFFACPEILLRIAPRFLVHLQTLQTRDLELAEALWLWFQLYLSDPAWFS